MTSLTHINSFLFIFAQGVSITGTAPGTHASESEEGSIYQDTRSIYHFGGEGEEGR